MVYCTIIANYRRCDLVIHYWTNIHMARFPELVIHVLRIYQFTNSHSTNEPNYMRACQLFPQHTDTQICQFAIGWMCMSTNLPMPENICPHLPVIGFTRVRICHWAIQPMHMFAELPMRWFGNFHFYQCTAGAFYQSTCLLVRGFTTGLVYQCTHFPNNQCSELSIN